MTRPGSTYRANGRREPMFMEKVQQYHEYPKGVDNGKWGRKPPVNGKRECARRLRQAAARGAP